MNSFDVLVDEIMRLVGSDDEDLRVIITGRIYERVSFVGDIEYETLKTMIVEGIQTFLKRDIATLTAETAKYYRKRYSL
jgi:hypothetical protein